MNIFELTAEWQRLQDALEYGEDVDELLQSLELVDMEITAKADGYARVIRNFEKDVAGLKEAETTLATKRKRLEHDIERMKANLYESMVKTGKRDFKTDLFSFKIVKNGGKQPVILAKDIDIQKMPKELLNIKITPNMDAIRDWILETGDFSYGELGERGESLRIK